MTAPTYTTATPQPTSWREIRAAEDAAVQARAWAILSKAIRKSMPTLPADMAAELRELLLLGPAATRRLADAFRRAQDATLHPKALP